MTTKLKQWTIAAALALAVLLALFAVGSNNPYELSVTFLGWTNIPPSAPAQIAGREARAGSEVADGFQAGDCALLGVTNSDTCELQFHAWAVEYESATGWSRVVPTNWPWFQGLAWLPQTGSLVSVPRPSEVPSAARWRIEFLCYLDGETDVGLGTRSNTRTRLNQLARKFLRKDTLLFYSPAKMVTPEILPIANKRGR
jgi:uncharacterized integral membrane protein